MDIRHKENISALLDGELDHEQADLLSGVIKANEALKKKLDQYALASGVIRQQVGTHDLTNLLGAVKKELHKEAGFFLKNLKK